jgi:acetyl-CoA C-acetyltransferase
LFDAFGVTSNARAARAWEERRFGRRVVPVKDRYGLANLAADEHVRPGSSLEGLGMLSPSFALMGEMGGFDAVALQKYHHVEAIQHVHTAGNSSGIVDGAAIMLIASEAVGKELGLTPRARFVSTALSGGVPTIMLVGPAPATRKALARAGMR